MVATSVAVALETAREPSPHSSPLMDKSQAVVVTQLNQRNEGKVLERVEPQHGGNQSTNQKHSP